MGVQVSLQFYNVISFSSVSCHGIGWLSKSSVLSFAGTFITFPVKIIPKQNKNKTPTFVAINVVSRKCFGK